MPDPTWVPDRRVVASPTGLSPALVRFSKRLRLASTHSTTPVPRPRVVTHAVWASPRSLAATKGVSVDFFSSRYLDVSVPWVFLENSGLNARWAAPPDISQPSTLEFLMTPRHSPRALRSLTTPIGPPRLGKGVEPIRGPLGPRGGRSRRLATRVSVSAPCDFQILKGSYHSFPPPRLASMRR